MLRLRKNEPLSRHTTLRIGGPAQFFIAAQTEEEIQDAIQFARTEGLPISVLGGGSNLWVSDAGVRGLALKIATTGVKVIETPETTELVAEAGEEWDWIIGFAVDHRLCGLENMSLIPGTVGGAVIGNIGAYGVEVKDSLLWVEALDMQTGQVRRFSNKACAFGYRTSFFKTPEGATHLVLRAAFALKPNAKANLGYKDLRDYFAHGPYPTSDPTPTQVRDAVIAIRRRKLPEIERVGTAGSFFRNPIIPETQFKALAEQYPGLPSHPEAPGLVKIPLGWVLDKICGLKGIRHGKVGTHSEQALVIVNEGGTAAEVEAFADFLAGQVKQRTGLVAEWEVVRLGDIPNR